MRYFQHEAHDRTQPHIRSPKHHREVYISHLHAQQQVQQQLHVDIEVDLSLIKGRCRVQKYDARKWVLGVCSFLFWPGVADGNVIHRAVNNDTNLWNKCTVCFQLRAKRTVAGKLTTQRDIALRSYPGVQYIYPAFLHLSEEMALTGH